MLRKIEHTRIILRMLYESLFTILIISFLSLFFLKVQLGFKVLGIVMLLFIISYMIRMVSPNNIIVFGIHSVLLAGCYYLPYEMGIRILVAGVVIFLIRDALLFIARESQLTPLDGAPWPTFLISFAIYLFSLYHGEKAFLIMAYLIPMLLIVLYYMMRYVEGLSDYYLSTRDIKDGTMRRIVSTNTIVIGMILVVFFAGICIGNFHLLENVFKRLLPLLIEGLRIVVLTIVFLLGKLIPSFQFSEEEILQKEGEEAGMAEDTSDASLLWAAYLMLSVAFLFILYTLLKRFIRLLMLHRSIPEGEQENNNHVVIEVESLKPLRKKVPKASVLDKGRRYYRKRILKYKLGKISNKHSCWDIAKIIKEEQQEDVSQLTEYYSQLRYGREDADNQAIIEEMKKLSRKKDMWGQ